MSARSAAEGGLQLDLLGCSGLKTTRALRTALDHIDRLARFHDQQGRGDAPISITKRQSEELNKTLRVEGRELRWRGHPLRVFVE